MWCPACTRVHSRHAMNIMGLGIWGWRHRQNANQHYDWYTSNLSNDCCSYAEMESQQKNKLSHQYCTLDMMCKYLCSLEEWYHDMSGTKVNKTAWKCHIGQIYTRKLAACLHAESCDIGRLTPHQLESYKRSAPSHNLSSPRLPTG